MPNLIYPHAFSFAYHFIELPHSIKNDEDRNKIERGDLPHLNQDCDYKIHGSYSKHYWDDTTYLFLGCAIEENKIEPRRPYFPELRDCLKYNYKILKPAGELIGKTWGFAGYLPDANKDAKAYAKTTYESLGWGEIDLESKSISVIEFEGATAFEFWQLPRNWNNLETESKHILILVFASFDAIKNINFVREVYHKLLYCRHRILWSYAEIRKLTPRLEDKRQRSFDNSKANRILDLSLGDLKKQLKENLVDLTNYSKELSELEVQKQTIAANLHNYNLQLNKLHDVSSDRFSDMVKFYQLQIESDYAALSPGLQLREKWLDTIRGMVEIQQVEADRNLEETIAIVGVGIGASSIAASLSSTYVAEIRQIPIVRSYLNFWELNPTQANLVVAVNVSIWMGIVVGGFLGCIIWIGKKWRSR